MSASDWREQLPQRARIMQIIVGAMFLGCLFFLIIVALVAKGQNKAADLTLTYIALAFAGMIIVPWLILPGIIVSQGRKNIHRTQSTTDQQTRNQSADDKKDKENRTAMALLDLFQTKTIIACALPEGAAFFLLVVYMNDQSPLALLAAIVLMILLIAQMPTTGRVTNWIKNQLLLIDQEREFG